MMRKGDLSFRYNAEKVIGIWSMLVFLASQCNSFSVTTWTAGHRQRYAVRKDVNTRRENGNGLISVVLASNDDDMDNVNNVGDDEMFASLNRRSIDIDEEKEIMGELAWRTKKISLEEANTRSFLKSKPWKLPYEESVSDSSSSSSGYLSLETKIFFILTDLLSFNINNLTDIEQMGPS